MTNKNKPRTSQPADGLDQPPLEDEADDLSATDALAEDYLADLEATEERKEAPQLAEEPLFAALLRRAVTQIWQDDPVLQDFCDSIAAPLSARLGHVAAKGGDFVLLREQEGKTVEDRYRYDQSFRAHLINGLFPVIRIARRLKDWGAPQLRRYDERAERLFIAGYTLHDWLKLPSTHAALENAGLTHDKVNAALHGPLVERIFRDTCREFGIDIFLRSLGGADAVLHDLIFVACNTQVKWGTMRNVSALPKLTFSGPILDLCEQLSRLADLITYVGRTPREAVTNSSIRGVLSTLSNGNARLVCHHVSDNRGILTNLIHNAALRAMRHESREPLLFAPSGVVYLEREGAPAFPPIAQIAEDTVEWIKRAAKQKLLLSGNGMTRGPIGIKVAEYYKDLFDSAEFVKIAAQIIPSRVIVPSKKSLAAERYQKIFASERLDAKWTNRLPVDIQVDQLAEWCQMCEVALRDTNEHVSEALLQVMELGSPARAEFAKVPRENRITGGIGLHWYFAAGEYRLRHAGLDPEAWRNHMIQLADRLAQAVGAALLTTEDPWQETRDYIRRELSFVTSDGRQRPRFDHIQFAFPFVNELRNYSNAKRSGRGSTVASSVSSSPYASQEQRETMVLFAPQVYTSKLPLHGSKAIRGIDPISSKEMMLRQLFMNRSNAIGAKYEGQKVRYLYFYPMYFFSPETLRVFDDLYARLANFSITQTRKQLVDEHTSPPTLRLDADTLQRLEDVLLSDEPPDADQDRMIRMRFPEDMPITFYFIGIPSVRDPTDAESWARPALLALLMPPCADVKVVASESALPLMNESDDICETVMFDGAHAFVQHLIGTERVNIDHVHPTLKRLLVSYFVHLDANAKSGAGGFDYAWRKLPPLARDLDSSAAYACYYLKKWQRTHNLDTIPENKALLYANYTRELEHEGGHDMTVARELVTRYRGFYRARKYNSNSILRPIAIASRAVLTADPRAFPDADSLVELAHGALSDFIERVSKGTADGYFPAGVKPEDRNAAMQAFADYFVRDVFYGAFRGDRAALRGKQLNLLKSACEVLYREAQAHERATTQAKQADEEAIDTDE